MSYKLTSSLKALPPYRRLFGFVILLYLSTSAQSDDSEDGVIYIDCSVTAHEVSDPSYVFTTNNSYRLDTKKKKFAYYSEKRNEYIDRCDSSCVISDDSIVWKTYSNEENMDSTFNYNINRWTGKFEGSSTQFQSGKLKYQLKHYGECQNGVSLLKSKPKF
jgi:hypothetical protein